MTQLFVTSLLSCVQCSYADCARMRQLQVYQRFPPSQDRRVMHGTMAAALAAPVLVVLLDIVSLFILFYKTWKHNGTGFRQAPLPASTVVGASAPKPCVSPCSIPQ